ncbi:hypothetical protein [Nonlabens xiamenensis]|uniref:hypothetical protein n=1 Tax=Nonlabens xiamenensis TaxID=2341043 RepID=UPI000F612CB9|nr:hypothetical protein [Nonlabens xiamenensis]
MNEIFIVSRRPLNRTNPSATTNPCEKLLLFTVCIMSITVYTQDGEESTSGLYLVLSPQTTISLGLGITFRASSEINNQSNVCGHLGSDFYHHEESPEDFELDKNFILLGHEPATPHSHLFYYSHIRANAANTFNNSADEGEVVRIIPCIGDSFEKINLKVNCQCSTTNILNATEFT